MPDGKVQALSLSLGGPGSEPAPVQKGLLPRAAEGLPDSSVIWKRGNKDSEHLSADLWLSLPDHHLGFFPDPL